MDRLEAQASGLLASEKALSPVECRDGERDAERDRDLLASELEELLDFLGLIATSLSSDDVQPMDAKNASYASYTPSLGRVSFGR